MTERKAGIGRRLAIGDWNAHHPDWTLKTNRDYRGTQLEEGMTQLGLNVVKECFWKIFRRGDQQRSRIDLVFKSEEVQWTNMESEWLQSDHAYVTCMLEIQQALLPPNTRKTLDKTKVEAYFKEVGDMQPEEQEAWYKTLEGDSPYSKLWNLARKHQREVRINERSKKWWDKDLKSQLLKVRRLGRGGQGEGRRTAQPEKWQKWRKEKT